MSASRNHMGLWEGLAAATGIIWWDGWRTGVLKKYFCLNLTPLIYGQKYTCKQLHRRLICHEYQSVDWNSSGLLTIFERSLKNPSIKEKGRDIHTHPRMHTPGVSHFQSCHISHINSPPYSPSRPLGVTPAGWDFAPTPVPSLWKERASGLPLRSAQTLEVLVVKTVSCFPAPCDPFLFPLIALLWSLEKYSSRSCSHSNCIKLPTLCNTLVFIV